jgi:simple sugar transport system ATP-binding protein
MEYIIQLKNIYKSFGEIRALSGVNFNVGYNEIVGLIGDNGAGKSTLIKILMGVHPPDSGEIRFEGKRIKNMSVKKANELGIQTVYQEQALAKLQTIWRNIFMGKEITNRLGFIDIEKSRNESMKVMRKIGFKGDITADSVIRNLSGGEREGVAIARVMYFKAKLVILDEPTMALSVKETGKVLSYAKKVKERGNSVIFITHNLYHVFPVADRFVILDRGRKVADVMKKNTSIDSLHKKIIKA